MQKIFLAFFYYSSLLHPAPVLLFVGGKGVEGEGGLGGRSGRGHNVNRHTELL